MSGTEAGYGGTRGQYTWVVARAVADLVQHALLSAYAHAMMYPVLTRCRVLLLYAMRSTEIGCGGICPCDERY
eukprot:508034-Rhodomonas_salina.2